jgi:hypothetical protein
MGSCSEVEYPQTNPRERLELKCEFANEPKLDHPAGLAFAQRIAAHGADSTYFFHFGFILYIFTAILMTLDLGLVSADTPALR